MLREPTKEEQIAYKINNIGPKYFDKLGKDYSEEDLNVIVNEILDGIVSVGNLHSLYALCIDAIDPDDFGLILRFSNQPPYGDSELAGDMAITKEQYLDLSEKIKILELGEGTEKGKTEEADSKVFYHILNSIKDNWEKIEAALNEGKSILCMCSDGKSRSVTACAILLMLICQKSPVPVSAEAVLGYIRSERKMADPRAAFKKELKIFEEKLFGGSKCAESKSAVYLPVKKGKEEKGGTDIGVKIKATLTR